MQTVRQLAEELTEVDDWYMLGIHLDVPVPKLRQIKANTEKTEHGRIEMFYYWLSRHTSPSWKDVIVALERMEHHALAAKLKKKVHPYPATF